MERVMRHLTATLGYVVSVCAASCLAPEAAGSGTQPMASTVRVDLEDGRSFLFQEVSALGMQLDVINYSEADDPTVRKTPGRAKYPNIVLRREQTESADLWHWIESAQGGTLFRQDLTVTLVDSDGRTLTQYQALRCFPASLTVETGLRGARSRYIEQLEIATETVDLIE